MPRQMTRETKTTEEIEVPERDTQGLGMPPLEYLESCPAEELALSTVKVYRMEPPGQRGAFIVRLQPGERIDEQWLLEKFGGGVFAVKVYVKGDPPKSGYDPSVRVDGVPKMPGAAPATVPTSANGTGDATNARILELLEKTIERLENRTAPAPPSAAQDASIKLVAEGASQAIKLVTDQMGNRTPAAEDGFEKQLRQVMLERLLHPPKEQSLADKLAELKTLKELLQPAGGGTKSLIEQVKELRDAAETLGLGGGEGGKKFSWLDLVQTAIDKGPEILDRLGQFSSDRVSVAREQRIRTETAAAAMRRGAPPPPSALPAGGAPPVARPPQQGAPPAPGAGLRMTPLGDEPAAPEPAPAVPPIDTESPAFIAHVKQRVVELVEEGSDGPAIVDFLYGNKQFGLLKMLGEFPVPRITAFLAQDPVLLRATQNPEWPRLLEEAKEYLAETAAAAAPAPPRPN